ncbi:hypothetical protein L596_007902 [Steinernema carpocapsae]|uniref:Uncharacterized protein n=1 Tax=Steinernema carpocapsae TaxID=34508 RepID=A0A4V6A652_STECR|nr:hypothetical protein L596_007902 [Steinernema carpocapsae]
MNGRTESARVMEEEVTVGSGVLAVESPASAGMHETFAMASISESPRSSPSAQLRSKRQNETPEEAKERGEAANDEARRAEPVLRNVRWRSHRGGARSASFHPRVRMKLRWQSHRELICVAAKPPKWEEAPSALGVQERGPEAEPVLRSC